MYCEYSLHYKCCALSTGWYWIDWAVDSGGPEMLSTFQTWLLLVFQAQTICFVTLAFFSCLFNHILVRAEVAFGSSSDWCRVLTTSIILSRLYGTSDSRAPEVDSGTHKWQLLASDVQTPHLMCYAHQMWNAWCFDDTEIYIIRKNRNLSSNCLCCCLQNTDFSVSIFNLQCLALFRWNHPWAVAELGPNKVRDMVIWIQILKCFWN